MKATNASELLLSKGTCYFGAGQVADKHFLPCGNADLQGAVACCYEGDYCLSSNTCWDNATVVTYIAGCTDSKFRADTCPQRYEYPDQQWVALAKCEGDDADKWTGCARHPELISIEKENCNCNASNVLIQNPNGKDSFDEIGRLPGAIDQEIAYQPTAVPTAVLTDSSASKAGGSGDDGGLSTGAKAGIGVGVSIGALLIVAAICFLLTKRRRQKRFRSHGSDWPQDADGQRHYHAGTEKHELGADHSTIQKVELSPESKPQEMPIEHDFNGIAKSAYPGR